MHILDFGRGKSKIIYIRKRKKNIYQPLIGKKPIYMKGDEWKILDRQSHDVIQLLLSHNVAFNIAKENTNESIMAAFTIMYEIDI